MFAIIEVVMHAFRSFETFKQRWASVTGTALSTPYLRLPGDYSVTRPKQFPNHSISTGNEILVDRTLPKVNISFIQTQTCMPKVLVGVYRRIHHRPTSSASVHVFHQSFGSASRRANKPRHHNQSDLENFNQRTWKIALQQIPEQTRWAHCQSPLRLLVGN